MPEALHHTHYSEVGSGLRSGGYIVHVTDTKLINAKIIG